jgi:hypothetical protein
VASPLAHAHAALSIAEGKRASSLGLTFIHRILAGMARTPAPLDVVAQKLAAPHKDQRLVALAHAAAHGTAARSLAVKVAAMLEDESAAVQHLAGGIFPRIGAGATDAVPLLLALRAKGVPPGLVARATLCLGCIGPSALAAIPPLKAALRQRPDDSDVLKALWQIAGDDPEVVDAVFAGAFASDFGRFLVASELIRNASDPVLDRAFAAIASRAQSPDPDDQQRAAKLLMTIAAKRPALASALVQGLLRDPTAPQAWHAVTAARECPPPRGPDLIAAITRVAAGDDVAASLRALQVLADFGAEASSAQATFLAVIARNGGCAPLPGPDGARASALAVAAKALANACPTDRAFEPLLAWLQQAIARHHTGARLCWYPIGDVIEALATLAPASTAVHAASLAAVAAARGSIAENEYEVMDFERCVRRAFERMANPAQMFDKAVELGMPRTDPDTASDEPDASDTCQPLPDFPSDDRAEASAAVAPLDGIGRQAVAALSATGRGILGLGEATDPGLVAQTVDRWLRSCKRQGTSPSEEEQAAVAATFGEAVAHVTGWQWQRYLWQGWEYLALTSPDATHVHVPLIFVAGQLATTAEVTALLLFNMLAAGERPQASASGQTLVG